MNSKYKQFLVFAFFTAVSYRYFSKTCIILVYALCLQMITANFNIDLCQGDCKSHVVQMQTKNHCQKFEKFVKIGFKATGSILILTGYMPGQLGMTHKCCLNQHRPNLLMILRQFGKQILVNYKYLCKRDFFMTQQSSNLQFPEIYPNFNTTLCTATTIMLIEKTNLI